MKQSRNHNNNNHNDNSNTTNTTNNDNNNRSSSSNHKNDGDFKKSIRREKSPKRQYFDTHIGIPLTVEELDFDSEDEDRNDQNIDEYTDVNVMSKDFMKLWNANTEIYGDRYDFIDVCVLISHFFLLLCELKKFCVLLVIIKIDNTDA